MANTPVEFAAKEGLTLTLEAYPVGSDTIANGGGGDACTERTNNKGVYTATIAESISGIHWLRARDAADNTRASWVSYLKDTTDVVLHGEGLSAEILETGGSGPWSTGGSAIGSGGIPWTVTVNDGGGAPIQGVDVWVTTDSAGSNIVAGALTTDAFGQTTFMLDAGTYYFWKQKAGYDFTNPETDTVA